MRHPSRLAATGAVIGAVAAIGVASTARAVDYAPLDRPGPPLSVPEEQLRDSLRCTGDVAGGAHEPILLVPGTTLTPDVNFSWNYEPALRALGLPHCTVELPNHAMSDIQIAAEYVVYAIRAANGMSGRQVQIIGFSQGGMVPRWALRFWPDTRPLVDDLVGLAPSNHGTLDADTACGPVSPCPPSFWQQASHADFIEALNSGLEVFPGISYTVAYTHFDEVVTPNFNDTGSSSLRGDGEIANVALQDLCPTEVADHLATGSYDPVAYALAIDAITHPGPADPSRIAASVCSQGLAPGVDPATFAGHYAELLATVANQFATYPRVPDEPPLACYVFAEGCGNGADASCAESVRGTRGRDKLVGSSAGDDIRARAGNDFVRARPGDDCVNGGQGRDRIRGGAGSDVIRARGGGDDEVNCGKGEDRVVAGHGDRLRNCELIKRR